MKKLMLLLIGLLALLICSCPPPPIILPPEEQLIDRSFFYLDIGEHNGNSLCIKSAENKSISAENERTKFLRWDNRITFHRFNSIELMNSSQPLIISTTYGDNHLVYQIDFKLLGDIILKAEKSEHDLKVLEQFKNSGFLEGYVQVDNDSEIKYIRTYYVNLDHLSSSSFEFPDQEVKKLIYMVGDNDLYNNAVDDLRELEEGFYGCDTYIFFDVPKTSDFRQPVILKLKRNLEVFLNDGIYDSDERFVKDDAYFASSIVYQFDKDFDSLSIEGMEQVFNIVNPNKEKFHTVLFWSHGSDWLPVGIEPANVYTTSSFGVDNSSGTQMTITDLASIFSNEGSGYSTDLLCFDCCTMGSVEVSSILKGKNVKTVLSPTTQIMEEGFDYREFIKVLTTPTAPHSLGKAPFLVDAIINNYKNVKPLGVVAYDLEAFASLPALFKDHFTPSTVDFDAIRAATAAHYSSSEPTKAILFYDFYSFMEQNGGVPTLIEQLFTNSLYVKSKNLTPKMGVKGLSCYIPYQDNNANLETINAAFKQTPWYSESGYGNKFGW